MKKIILFIFLLQASTIWGQQLPELFMDLNPTGDSNPYGFYIKGNQMYFAAETGQGIGLWVTDGTEDNTQLLKVLDVGTPTISNFLDWEPLFQEMNDKLYFAGNDSISGNELWVTDGTVQGTQLVKNINPDSISIYIWYGSVHNDKLLFHANDSISGNELWGSDGSTQGTQLIKDINPGPASGATFQLTHELGVSLENDLIFNANTEEFGAELWKTDGTTAGTQMIKDINPGPNSSFPSFISPVYDGKVYFSAHDSINGIELWATDGTAQGTQLVKDINPGTLDSRPSNFRIFNGLLYFLADHVDFSRELWVTNGTTLGTQLVKDINPTGSAYSTPGWQFNPSKYDLFEFQNKLYFAANDGVSGRELWTTDGTTVGTQMVKDICPGDCSSSPFFYETEAGQLFFSADDGSNGTELWITDGTTMGTEKTAPAISPNINPLGNRFASKVFKDAFYFTADYDGNGVELFRIPFDTDAVKDVFDQKGISFFPNPVAETGTIEFSLNQKSRITCYLFDVTGRMTYSWPSENLTAGIQRIELDFSKIPGGIHFLKIDTGSAWKTVKVVKQ